MKCCWILCCFLGLTLGQSQMIDIKCPKNHFLGNIMTNVPNAIGFICITCQQPYSAELNSHSSQSLALCYSNFEGQFYLKLNEKIDLKNVKVGKRDLCGISFDLKNDAMALTGLITCAKENYTKKFLERGQMICPLKSTLTEMSHRKVLHEWCILCEWNKTYDMKLSLHRS